MRNVVKVWLGGFQEDQDGYDFYDPIVHFFALNHKYTDKDGTFLGVI